MRVSCRYNGAHSEWAIPVRYTGIFSLPWLDLKSIPKGSRLLTTYIAEPITGTLRRGRAGRGQHLITVVNVMQATLPHQVDEVGHGE
jgi:hypothetical protein